MDEYALSLVPFILGCIFVAGLLVTLNEKLTRKPKSNEDKMKEAIRNWIKEEQEKVS